MPSYIGTLERLKPRSNVCVLIMRTMQEECLYDFKEFTPRVHCQTAFIVIDATFALEEGNLNHE